MANNIANELENITNKWHIKHKTVCITANAGVTGWQHLPYFAHTPNLVITDVIKEDGVLQVQQRAKNVVSFFNHSVIATKHLSDV